jgi:DMSO/TMAO reductase YedYZ molybdopterin-dependent catalytic subunit
MTIAPSTTTTGPIQQLDAKTFKLKVAGLVQHEQQYLLADLKNDFTKFEVVAALQVIIKSYHTY